MEALLVGQTYDAHPHLEQGMMVEVIRGPLIGLQGKLLRKTEGCRLVITINLIGQGAAVHINADDIAPVQSSSHFDSLAVVGLVI